MALYNASTGSKTNVPVAETPKPYDEGYRNAIVSSTQTNQTSLLSNVTGTPVMVTYYRQHLGKDEEAVGLQMDDMNVYQSYEIIKGLILKFEGKPSFSFNAEKAESTEEGTAWVMADLSPIIGDMFVRDIGDGRAGLYQLTEQPELRSYAADKVYLISFKMIDIMTQAIEDGMTAKVVKEYYYSKDSVLSGGNALITGENKNLTESLLKTLPALTTRLYEIGYFNPEETIVLLEENNTLVYDESLTRYLSQIVPVASIGRLKPINLINTQVGVNFGYNKPQTVWDAILYQNEELLKSLSNKQYRYYRTQFFTTRSYGNPAFTKISYFLVPRKLQYNGVGLNATQGIQTIIPDTETQAETPTYFSDSFYTGVPTTEFEKIVYDFAFRGIRDRKTLLTYIEKSFSLADRDFLYQAGPLIMMVQMSRRILIGD